MTVAIIVQSDDGDVADANAYSTVAEYRAYHALRGHDVTAYTDDQVATDIIRATDHVDTTKRFSGQQLTTTQTTAWPRKCARKRNGQLATGIPREVKYAVAEYALRARTAALVKDTPQPDDGRLVKSTTDKVDVLETTVVYETTPGFAPAIPSYPEADNWLISAGLVAPSGITLVR